MLCAEVKMGTGSDLTEDRFPVAAVTNDEDDIAYQATMQEKPTRRTPNPGTTWAANKKLDVGQKQKQSARPHHLEKV